MEGTGFLKTVNFGGFDKKDVLTYVDQLNTKIYTLEAELNEKTALLENAGEGGGVVNDEKYEELLAADKAKITELQTSNDSLRNQMKSMEDELAAKNEENENLKAQIAELETQLQEAKNKAAATSDESNAMDLGNVFIEAQKTANIIVTQAKENARKMDEDAKKLANQVVDDANGKASTIVKNADEKASRILSDAEDRSAEMRNAAETIKATVTAEIADIETNVSKLKEVLEMFSSESLSKLDETKALIDKTQNSIKASVPLTAKPAVKPAAAPAPAPAPAPVPAPEPVPEPVVQEAAPAPEPEPVQEEAPAPAPTPAPKKKLNNFGFDMSELESLAKAAEAADQ